MTRTPEKKHLRLAIRAAMNSSPTVLHAYENGRRRARRFGANESDASLAGLEQAKMAIKYVNKQLTEVGKTPIYLPEGSIQ